jgi:hypothetical protein
VREREEARNEKDDMHREWVPPVRASFLRRMGRVVKNGERGSIFRWRRLSELQCHFTIHFEISSALATRRRVGTPRCHSISMRATSLSTLNPSLIP